MPNNPYQNMLLTGGGGSGQGNWYYGQGGQRSNPYQRQQANQVNPYGGQGQQQGYYQPQQQQQQQYQPYQGGGGGGYNPANNQTVRQRPSGGGGGGLGGGGFGGMGSWGVPFMQKPPPTVSESRMKTAELRGGRADFQTMMSMMPQLQQAMATMGLSPEDIQRSLQQMLMGSLSKFAGMTGRELMLGF